MGSDRIAVAIEGGVAHVELARPDKFNAMDKAMFAAIGDTFRALGRDPDGAGDPAVRAGASISPPGSTSNMPRASSRRAPMPGRAAEARLRHIEWLQDAFSAVEQARRAGDRRDPWRLHRRRRRPRQRLRPARRRRRRLLPGRRGRRRDHRRSRHAAAARLSDPAGRASRARPIPAAGWRPRRRRATASSTASRPDREAAIAAGLAARRGHRRQVAAGGRRRQEEPQPQPRPPGRGGPARRRHVERRRLWSAPDIGEAVRARLGKTEPSFAPLDD